MRTSVKAFLCFLIAGLNQLKPNFLVGVLGVLVKIRTSKIPLFPKSFRNISKGISFISSVGSPTKTNSLVTSKQIKIFF